MRALQFAKNLMEHVGEDFKTLQLFTNDHYYETPYNAKCLILKARANLQNGKHKDIGFNTLLEAMGDVPYLTMNKRAVVQKFMSITIICEKKEYDGHEFYDTLVHVFNDNDKLIPKLVSLQTKVYDRIKEYRGPQIELDGFDELD